MKADCKTAGSVLSDLEAVVAVAAVSLPFREALPWTPLVRILHAPLMLVLGDAVLSLSD